MKLKTSFLHSSFTYALIHHLIVRFQLKAAAVRARIFRRALVVQSDRDLRQRAEIRLIVMMFAACHSAGDALIRISVVQSYHLERNICD